MKKANYFPVIIIITVLIIGGYFVMRNNFFPKTQAQMTYQEKDIYYCPMHPNFTSDKPGSCSICGMNLVKKERAEAPKTKSEKKLLYYRNPMDPTVTSPVAMKDSMGMDYVPVYSEEATANEPGVYVSPEKQQLIGVATEKIAKKHLIYSINTVGKVAYPLDFYADQAQYILDLKTALNSFNGSLRAFSLQANPSIQASRKKLLLQGMTQSDIDLLVKNRKLQNNIPWQSLSERTIVYMTIYEYEISQIKNGAAVEISASAYPGEIFKGSISAVPEVLNPETRSLQVRAEVSDPGRKLKPDMFVDAKILTDLGEKLALPVSAVLDTGTKKIVYIKTDNDRISPQEVVTGQKTDDYYEIISGVHEGDDVITSGNFLIDSESKLNSMIKN
ncbi:MAG: efflux RND transporter periplasmic adaptor subunit [Candidatus Omnitrophica bacterium]|nr:efflux RND transporter periplasmic adaptor subunit [Candidatus Omnitrophota bacterium]